MNVDKNSLDQSFMKHLSISIILIESIAILYLGLGKLDDVNKLEASKDIAVTYMIQERLMLDMLGVASLNQPEKLADLIDPQKSSHELALKIKLIGEKYQVLKNEELDAKVKEEKVEKLNSELAKLILK